MNPHRLTKHPRSLVSTLLTQVALIVCLMTFSALCNATAQSAHNFDTQEVAPVKPVTEAAKADQPAAIEAAPAPVSTTPSRYVGTAETESYVKTVAAAFSIRKRATDIFGQLQDPDAKPIVKAPTPGALKRIAPVQATPLSEIVRLLVVTTIMPGEKKFLLGTRSVCQGDQLPLSFRGKELRVQVTEVTSRQIGFRNLDTGETAFRKLDMLPVGMTPGSRGITAPGMVADSPNSPIELETGNPVP